MRIKFEKWKSRIPLLKELSIPSHLLKKSPYVKVTIHIFCDASQSAYVACVFIRAEFENNISSGLVQARNRVYPIKKITISRLELLSCTIGARLSKAAKEDLEFDESIPVYYWSYSSNALYWIKKNEYWVVYVYNRVQEIRKLTNPAKWRHISGSLNLVDLPSSGCNIEDSSRSRCTSLPEDRVIEASVSEVVGVDLCGPLYLKGKIIEVGVPDLDYIDSKKLNKRFIYKQKILQDLRIRFRNEYLGRLKDFSKVRKASPIEEGDIALVSDTNSKRINWPLGRVKKIYPGKDGIVQEEPTPSIADRHPVPINTRRVGQRCTLNLSRAETSSRWCGVVVRKGGASSGVVHVT
ncbi:DUF5641 domain-containing protein [Trichonephila clavipes]|nr:DUF5641 domain-containing protein [Trichonephila clavipes]